MLVVPVAKGLANPAAVIVATAVLLELQVAELVTSKVEPLLSVAIAVNCCFNPYAFDIFGLAGVITIDCMGIEFHIGVTGLTIIVNIAVQIPPPALIAFIVTFDVPATVGVPEISPVLVLSDKPLGKPLALKLVGVLVAVIV